MSDSLRPHEPPHIRLPCPSHSPSLLKPMSTESVMPSNHLILCHPLLLLPSIFLSIRVFSNELALLIRWPKYWSFRHDYEGKIWLLVHRTIPNVLTAVLRWEPFSLHLGDWEGGKCVCVCWRWKKLKDQGTATCKERPGLPFTFCRMHRGTSLSWFAQDCQGIMGFSDGSVVKNPPAYIVLYIVYRFCFLLFFPK